MRILTFLLFVITASHAQNLTVRGLKQPVEVLRDGWGVNHIYAKNEHDLFFAQGYMAAQDRLFQLEMWRRQATGTVAELLGSQELKRDIGTRLFRFRPQDLDAELNRYHPRGSVIVRAFVEGINAYVTQINQTPDKLPFEFKTLNTRPGLWTPEVVISRHQGLLSNIRDELNYGRLVHLIGADSLRALQWFHPKANQNDKSPDLTLHVDGKGLMQNILELYEAFRLPVRFSKADKTMGVTMEDEALNRASKGVGMPSLQVMASLPPLTPSQAEIDAWFEEEKQFVGSNNWTISGEKSASGYPMLANDPHRAQSTPSLRYWTHLNAPGWNVIGAGEPTLPGISIGHNDYGAWGLTIFDTDNEDLYVYDINPANPNQYRYKGRWETMRTRRETIAVKGQPAQTVTLRYTRHGPVVFADAKAHKAYAVRAGWLEPGCSPYLASLRMNQARSWTEFRQACMASRVPGENMIWSDPKGTIGWQAVGLAPIRKNWTGLVPVPGDGRYEWAGFLPIAQLPHSENPKSGIIVTANNNLTPSDFPHRDAIGWVWAGPSRAQRIEEVLADGKRKTLSDFMRLQADYVALPARTLVPLLEPLSSDDGPTEQALAYLRKWNYSLDMNSVAASIYVGFETNLRRAFADLVIPDDAKPYLKTIPTKRLLDWAVSPQLIISRPINRDSLLLACVTQSVADLTKRLGPDMETWVYGQRTNKHITLTHALSDLVSDEQKKRINLGPVARGGYGETVNVTGSGLNQEHGASFRIVMDTEDWDRTMGINTPGQSGNPDSPHYRDLLPLWAENGYFPVFFSRSKIEQVTEQKTVLKP
ncbi:penicillin acylase family protein [Fibrella sp. HMF5335]|uniref:Penicillin acylase family protein n=1 Tax=Fibrella rubiginis TaxID=2817060 RepID=A0A939K0K8_9BACT|nr:penicillin acylase family protein [Fibrella rubiginis]MBO0936202.1 penicillin acylase family protein [Fibrella rubiginis]